MMILGNCDRQRLAQFPQESNTAEIGGRGDAGREQAVISRAKK